MEKKLKYQLNKNHWRINEYMKLQDIIEIHLCETEY